MTGKKDYTVVSVISGLTSKQASKLTSEIIFQKNKIAPYSKGTSASGHFSNVSSLIQNQFKRLGGK